MSLTDLQALAEGWDLEVKLAAGRHGRGELPSNVFETYSAMANTDGGVILLGFRQEGDGTFSVHGINDPASVQKTLWDGLNDRQRVNRNLMARDDVAVLEVSDKRVVWIRVPRATRQQRPIFVGRNPFEGTFRRNYEGDYHRDEETVRRMLAEQVEDARDASLAEGFDLSDLDDATIRAYRAQFRSAKPDHPWVDAEPTEFLRLVGAWTRNRESGKEGPSLAGLLMFGHLRSILDRFPNYVLDYQERPAGPLGATRWLDRITTDGTWSGNLYEFYRRVIQRLGSDLRVPFRLEGVARVDETPIHVALREALVNTLIHADYSDRIPILVVREPGHFLFRNPGGLRVSLVDAIAGGRSDCRNRGLQKMFQLAGLGEQAGSGVPRIFGSWRDQMWRLPDLREELDPDLTLLDLRMVSLLPNETLEELDDRLGPAFRTLPETQRLALATVCIEGRVTNARLQSMTIDHPSDLTQSLASLVRGGHLASRGAGRNTYYVFPDRDDASATHSGPSSTHSGPSSTHSGPSSTRKELDQPQTTISAVIGKVRGQRRVTTDEMNQAILEATLDFLTLRELADALGRAPRTLRDHYVRTLVRRGLLELERPDLPSHPGQRYRRVGAIANTRDPSPGLR